MKNSISPFIPLLAGAITLLATASLQAQSTYTSPFNFTTFAGKAGQFNSTDGLGTKARFVQPGALIVDKSGNIFVADSFNFTIRKITPAGLVSTFAGSAGDDEYMDGTGANATFNDPEGIAIDPSGTIYVADSGNYIIRKITTAGVVTTFAGKAFTYGTKDGTGKAALFEFPFAVAVDKSGVIYVADYDACNIRKITPAGVVTTLAGKANAMGSKDGTGTAALFNHPEGIAVDASNNVFVSDAGNDTIRKITPAGVVTTFAGTVGVEGSTDATGKLALFTTPEGLNFDPSGNLFVADAGNNTIRKITPAGIVTTVGGLAGTFGSKDGVGKAALFGNPTGVAFDSTGILYIADDSNDTIRKGIALKPQTIAAFTIPAKVFGTAPFIITVPKATSTLAVTMSVKSGPGTISSNQVTLTGAGSVTLAANQAGNATIAPAPEVTSTFVVSPGTQTITFPQVAPVKVGQKVTLTAKSTSGLVIKYAVLSGTATISQSSVTFTTAGNVKLSATQTGNANYKAATPVNIIVRVNP